MTQPLNTFADFLADFPYEPGWTEDSSIGAPGTDVAALLIKGLHDHGISIRSAGAMEYGHSIECLSQGDCFTIWISVDDPWEMRRWTIQCPSNVSTLARMAGKSDHKRIDTC